MNANVGTIDRLLRLVIGAFLIVAPLINFLGLGASATASYLLIAVGLVLGLTALFGFCPLYRVLGIQTKT